MKKLKALQSAHTPNTKYGVGDFYGTGVKAKMGTVRTDYINTSKIKLKSLKKPPKSLA